jgi:acetyltransferase-like isoleucine patch superfamily enzyme
MKKIFLKYSLRILGLLQQHQIRAYYTKIRSYPNVFIHEYAWLGENSTINIIGICKKLEIQKGVGTRSFCSFLLYPDATLVIGERTFFNNHCSVNCLGYIEIGENVMFGEGVKIYDHNHAYSYKDLILDVEKDKFTIGKVVIGSNTWIGSNVTILNNVEIGENVIIGANCLIYKSVPSNSIVKHAESLIITSPIQQDKNKIKS